MTLFRAFPFDASAQERDLGGALYVPPGGKGRVDSLLPRAYSVFYAASTPECAIAERFGAFDEWDRELIEASPATPLLPNSRFAIAAYTAVTPLRLCDMDDARTLVERGLRPSKVVTKDRSVTQAWATKIHGNGAYAGISWWSYYEPSWQSVGVWSHADLRLSSDPELLSTRDPRVRSAALAIKRRLRSH